MSAHPRSNHQQSHPHPSMKPHDPTPSALSALALTTLILAGQLLLSTPAPLGAQTILNTERFQLGEVDGFHLSSDLAVDLQRGNTRLLDLRASGIVGTLEGRHWPRVIFGGRYLRNTQGSLLDEQFIQLRYSYILSPETRTFHFVQAQKNESLLLQARWLVGSGIRTTFLDTGRTRVSAGTGLMGEWERLEPGRLGPDDDPRLSTLRMANLAVVSMELGNGARLLNISYYQPDVTDFGNSRMLNELGLLVPITHWIRTTISLEWRRDTRPPSALRKDDLKFRVGLGVDLR